MTEEFIKTLLNMEVTTVEWEWTEPLKVDTRIIFPNMPNKVRVEPDHVVISPIPTETE